MFLKILLFLSIFPNIVSSVTCEFCVQSGNTFCTDTYSCIPPEVSCQAPINVDFVCPKAPRVQYNDTFARTRMMVIASAAKSLSENTQDCFSNHFPTTTVYKTREVNCSNTYPNVTCLAYTAYDDTEQVIILGFRGSQGKNQDLTLSENCVANGSIPFFTNGRVVQAFYDSFMFLWDGGIRQDLRRLAYLYPNYKLWIGGHSLGGAMATIASGYIVKTGIFRGEDITLVVLGDMPVTDVVFSKWHWEQIPYSFHVIHRNDNIPRVDPFDPLNNVTMYHSRTEVWYNNYMREGDNYEVCLEAGASFCIRSPQANLTWDDHNYYFDIHLPNWGKAGCPKNLTGFNQE